MTDDIVALVRAYEWAHPVIKEAADEIERLRAALRLLIEWHDDTGAVMLDVLLDVARAALAGEHIADAGKKVAVQEAPTALAGEKKND